MLCLGMQSMCRTVSRSVTPPPAGADCMLEEHWPLSRGCWPRPPARPGQVASGQPDCADCAEQTRQAVLIPPTVQFYAKFCTETISIKQNRQRKRKRRIYICLMSQARNIHPVIHMWRQIFSRYQLNDK